MKRLKYNCGLFLAIIFIAQICFAQSREAIERTNLNNLQNYYATLDSNYASIVEQLPELETALSQLKDRITAAQAARSVFKPSTPHSEEQPAQESKLRFRSMETSAL
jgi:septal ring factor EnvC (AmiA/AmiB activator)